MKCNTNCKDFVKEMCKKITSSPYVCNGCEKRKKCHLDKYFYTALTAEKDYMTNLIETRQGINIDENKLKIIDATITPMFKNGHSPYQVLANNKDINLSVKTIYNYIDFGVLSVKNLNLPKKTKYKNGIPTMNLSITNLFLQIKHIKTFKIILQNTQKKKWWKWILSLELHHLKKCF